MRWRSYMRAYKYVGFGFLTQRAIYARDELNCPEVLSTSILLREVRGE